MKHIIEFAAKEDDKSLGGVVCYPKVLVKFKDMSSTILSTFTPEKKKTFGEIKIYSKSKTQSLIKNVLSGKSSLVSTKMNNMKFLIDDISTEIGNVSVPNNGYPREHSKKM